MKKLRPGHLFLLFLMVFSCTSDRSYPVTVESVSLEIYLNDYEEVKQAIAENPDDASLRKKKLYLGQALSWPEDVQEDIEQLIDHQGFTLEIFNYASNFYQAYGYYERLLDLLETWEDTHGRSTDLVRWRIDALLRLGQVEEANQYLWALLQDNKGDPGPVSYAGSTYLLQGDSTRALYAYQLLADVAPNHPDVLRVYAPLLIELGLYEEAYRKVSTLRNPEEPEDQLLFAQVLFQLDSPERAHRELSGFDETSILLTRVNWFEQKNSWDSALIILDRLLVPDSSGQILIRKGEVMEKRGWLNTAYSTYQAAVARDSTNELAQQKAVDVARKIAYLRSLREAEQRIPVLNIRSKKATDNE